VKLCLALVGVVILGAAVAGCCSGVGCLPEMSFVVHVASDRSGLEASTVTVCRNGLCMSGTPTWIDVTDPAGWENAGIGFTGAINGEGSIDVTPDGRATLYQVQVVDAGGNTLIDFSRKLQYTHRDICSSTCYGGSVEVWTSSANGLTCTALYQPSEAMYKTPELALSDGAEAGTIVDACRNASCARATWPGAFKGAISASLFGGRKGVGKPFVFRVYMYDDPAVLADGDHYTVTVKDQNQTVLAAVDQSATYTETLPDGPACDAFPTRTVTLGP
jgi:hypothetical protein